MSADNAVPSSNMTPSNLESSECRDLPKTDPVIKDGIHKKDVITSRQNSLKFYAVSTPEAVSSDSAVNFVFDDLPKALNYCKKLTSKNVRFKAFSSLEEACEFVSSPIKTGEHKVSVESPKSFSEEKGFSFPSLSSQQLVKFRQEIERGCESSVLDYVWSNPRYLVGSSDSLSVLHAGTRYNVFHVAAKSNQVRIFYSLLNTVQDFRFLSLLHPEKDDAMLERLRIHLLDLCLNMPCKPMHETPLHVAAKVGAVFIVKIMLSHDICEKKPNKHGKLPHELMCERCPELTFGGQPVKRMMAALFEDVKFYVPVVKDKGQTVLSSSYDLLTEDFVASFVASRKVKGSSVFMDSNPVFGAFAGPLSKQSAERLSNALKKKNFNSGFHLTDAQKSELRVVCRSDFSKGLERVGRILASGVDCDYLEFFPVVDDYISSRTGLEALECQLKCLKKLNHLKSSVTTSRSDMSPQTMCKHFVSLVDEVLLDAICEKLKHGFDASAFFSTGRVSVTFYFIHLFQAIIPNTLCLTLAVFQGDGSENSKVHDEIAHLLLLKSSSVFREDTLHTIVMHLNSVLYIIPKFQSQNYQHFLCLLKFFCYHHLCKWHETSSLTDKERTDSFSKPVCHCYALSSQQERVSHALYRNTLFSFPTSVFLDCVSEQKKVYNPLNPFSMEGLLKELEVCVKSEDSAFTSEPTLDEIESSESEDIFYLAQEAECDIVAPDVTEIYITGRTEFSSRDVDIYRWMEKTEIDESSYPHVFRYKSVVDLKLGTLMEQKTELSLTPASSSSAVERAMRIRSLHRKKLFK